MFKLLLMFTFSVFYFAHSYDWNSFSNLFMQHMNNPKVVNSLKTIHEKYLATLFDKSGLSPAARDTALITLSCAKLDTLSNNNIFTFIDYSLPANTKRIWVFDIANDKLLYNTYVSHGLGSGTIEADFFSNRYNSKASSIGVYTTKNSYYGRNGLSLQLDGLDQGFNDNASNRALVMHGGWYVTEEFIKKYGRSGRSWGCPALPKDQTQEIINTIKK